MYWHMSNGKLVIFRLLIVNFDFSDTIDPLGIVNAQLREQADAAI